MAEQNLNAAKVHAGFQQVSSKGVAKRMRMNCLGDAGELRGILASENDGVASEGLASFVAGKQPVRCRFQGK